MSSQSDDKNVLVATILFLLTKYSIDHDPSVGKAILEHLEMLQKHPKTSQPILLNTCEHLIKHWRSKLSIKSGCRNNCFEPKVIDTRIH